MCLVAARGRNEAIGCPIVDLRDVFDLCVFSGGVIVGGVMIEEVPLRR